MKRRCDRDLQYGFEDTRYLFRCNDLSEIFFGWCQNTHYSSGSLAVQSIVWQLFPGSVVTPLRRLLEHIQAVR